MNEDKIKGQWKQLAGRLKAKWGKLTDDDVRVADGNSEYLAGKIQERYGIATALLLFTQCSGMTVSGAYDLVQMI